MMNKEIRNKTIYGLLKLLIILFAMVMAFAGSMMSLLGMGIMNLMLTILSFDELFIESPFNQTSIETISNNMQPLIHVGAIYFAFGVITIVIALCFGSFGLIHKFTFLDRQTADR